MPDLQSFEFVTHLEQTHTFSQGIIVELPLAPFFLKQLLLRRGDVNDLATLDSELYRNLMFLREYEGDVEDLALTFTASRQVYGATSEVSGQFERFLWSVKYCPAGLPDVSR